MPRDPAGNYTLPEAPVQPSTTIETTWANPSFDDFAIAFQDSLSRSGQGGMLVPFKNVDGNQAGPGMTWVNELGSGFFRFGTGDYRAVVLGQPAARFSDADPNNPFQVWDGAAFANVLHVGYTLQLSMGDGTEAAPTYTYANSLGTGWWSSGPNIQNLSINGVEMVEFDASAMTVEFPVELMQTVPSPTGLRDGALVYNGAGGLALKVGSSFVTIPAVAPANNGNLIYVATPITANGVAIDGTYNLIDTTLAEIQMQMPAGVDGMRWGYIDFYRQFPTNNCVLVPDGTDLIEGVNENYEMNLQGVSGVMRFTTDRGWVDTGGMS